MKKKKAVILGVTGQDGSYLLEFLLSKNYEVHGLIRKAATTNTFNNLFEVEQKHQKNIDFSNPDDDELRALEEGITSNGEKIDS